MGAPKGNKNGKKAKDWERAIRAELYFYTDPSRNINKGEALQKIARMCVEDALSPEFEVRHAARSEIANRLDGKPREHVDLDFSDRLAKELSDEELLSIARGSGDRASDEEIRPKDPSGVH